MSQKIDGPDARYPDVEVELSGQDGNVFFIIGRVAKAIHRKHGADAAQAFRDEAFDQPSYDDVLQLVFRTVEVV